ncbi:chorismate mutase [Magnetospirillum sp. UT-4]|uniref:chorismate mutase n=1 Tax=Magnetospirillum sp. UT-4 TaxID=2681467 RepID=UPI0015737084|nr:chorismate mutase [Magnetospirillum sp. UT-4]
MTTDPQTLTRLRRDIDRIDDRLHDLLQERAALVERIAAAKAGENTVALRPGREAEILRRLVERHQGCFPKAALVRIWREIMGALVGIQGPFTVAVCQPGGGSGFVELARDHFGVVAPQTVFPSPGHVVRQVADGIAAVGVVPIPAAAEDDPWWPSLAADSINLPRIVARLPVLAVDHVPGKPEPLEGYVIAARDHDDTGDDRTLVVVETVPDVSRDRLRALLSGVSLDCTGVVATHRGGEYWLHLAEVAGHLTDADARLTALASSQKDAVRHLRVIGGYPVPLPV